jgi:hypothetical protein
LGYRGAARDTQGARPEGGSLGTDAKYGVSTLEATMDRRVERFALQSAAREILPKSRTALCLRRRAFKQEIQVWKSTAHGTASYTGLQTCGSVWACPVCAAKVAERRRVELMTGMATHQKSGGFVQMLTLTTPHKRTDDLAELLDKQKKALGHFWKDKQVRAVLAEMGCIGQVRALEVTHGRLREVDNGWHPHYHVLLFGRGECDSPRMKDWRTRLYLRWAHVCEFHGMDTPSFDHGLRLDDGSKAAKYASKWGLEDEMTKGHTKKAKDGETPFDLLRAYLEDSSDKQAAALFRQFAQVFHGKRQLHWSHGLKALLGIAERNDQQCAEEAEEAAYYLGTITLEQWRDVLAIDARGHVLVLAATQGWPAVLAFLHRIEGKRVPSRPPSAQLTGIC